MTYQYTYSGDQDINLPTVGVSAVGGDSSAIYTVDSPIAHPFFHEVVSGEAQPQPEEVPQQPAPQEEVPAQPQEQAQPEIQEQPEQAQPENIAGEEGTQVE